MSAVRVASKGWQVKPTAPPKLNNQQWVATEALGVVLLVMALLQLVSFNDFRDALNNMGLAGPAAWAAVIIFAELIGAVGFFKVPLSFLMRMVSATLAVAVAVFWFIENLQIISGPSGESLTNSGFFGRFLTQEPSWWTAAQVTLLLFWTIYAVGLFKNVLVMPKSKK